MHSGKRLHASRHSACRVKCGHALSQALDPRMPDASSTKRTRSPNVLRSKSIVARPSSTRELCLQAASLHHRPRLTPQHPPKLLNSRVVCTLEVELVKRRYRNLRPGNATGSGCITRYPDGAYRSLEELPTIRPERLVNAAPSAGIYPAAHSSTSGALTGRSRTWGIKMGSGAKVQWLERRWLINEDRTLRTPCLRSATFWLRST